jgi:rubrerythrin
MKNMEKEVLDIMIRIEDELASLYTKIRNISRFSRIKEVLEYLIEETNFHSKRIEGLKVKFEKPVLQTSMIPAVYDMIKDSLFHTLAKEKNYSKCVDLMAATEESIGKIYTAIAKYYSRMSEYYQRFSDEINQVYHEEFEHRDVLLKKKSRIDHLSP